MKKKKWVDVLVLIALLLIGGALRVIYTNYYMTTISISDEILRLIKQNSGNPFACLSFSFDGVYAFILTFAIQYLGNKAIVGVGINILLQLISIFLIYHSIRIVSDTLIATIPTLIIAILPVYIVMIGNLTSFTLIYVAVAACVFIFLVFCKLISLLFKKDSDEEDYEDYEAEVIEEKNKEQNTIANKEVKSKEMLHGEVIHNQNGFNTEEETEEYDDDEVGEPSEYIENIGDVFQTEKEKNDLSEDALDVLTGEKDISTLKNMEKPRKQEKSVLQNEAEHKAVKNYVIDKAKDSADSKYDFMHYDIEDMTDMDFFDLDS